MRRIVMVSTSLFVALSMAVALAACSSDSKDSGSSDTEQPSKQRFIEQADAICTAGRERAQKISAPNVDSSKSPSQLTSAERDQVAQYLQQSLDEGRRVGDELEKLDAPRDLRSDVTEYLSTARDALQAGNEYVQALRAGDDTATQAASEKVDQTNAQTKEIARRIGFAVCSAS